MILYQETPTSHVYKEDKYDLVISYSKEFHSKVQAKMEFRNEVDMVKRQIKLEKFMKSIRADSKLKYYNTEGEPVFVTTLRKDKYE